MEERWYKLDNAAKIYPAIRESQWSAIFRISAVLKSRVDPEVLQEALKLTYKRFPSFSVNIARGLFWYYFEPVDSEPRVMPEDTWPMRTFSEERDRGYLFRVVYYGRKVSLEVFHSISDGHGAVTFLKTLLYNYFHLLDGIETPPDREELERYGILYYRDNPAPEETEDSFQLYSLPREKLDLKEGPAFKIPGTRIDRGTIRITHVLMDSRGLIGLSKQYNSTVTEFLTAILMKSIIEARVYNEGEEKPIRISVPVNLRSRFPSKTMRNFSSYVNVEVYPGKITELQDICSSVREQMKSGTEKESLRKKFSGNVNSEKSIAIRIAPLFIKNLVLRTVFFMVGERITTTTLSNIGKIELPEDIRDRVERFDAILGAPKQNAINCAVMSYDDTVSLTFTSTITENSIAKKLVDFLVGKGIETSIETNY